jgi:hypothetical protein
MMADQDTPAGGEQTEWEPDRSGKDCKAKHLAQILELQTWRDRCIKLVERDEGGWWITWTE